MSFNTELREVCGFLKYSKDKNGLQKFFEDNPRKTISAKGYNLINEITNSGMKPLEGQSVVPDKSYFRPELIVVDVPYSPLETKMRSMAKEVGCKTMNGLGMMLFQGSAAFELWTGEPMPIEHMKEVLNIKYD